MQRPSGPAALLPVLYPVALILRSGTLMRLLRAVAIGGLLGLALASLSGASSLDEAEQVPGPTFLMVGQGGSLTGTVTLSEKMITRPARFHIYPDHKPVAADRKIPTEQDEMANVVIYLESPGTEGFSSSPELLGRRTMKQQDEQFIPHVLSILKGTTVEFPNADPIFHNVFSLSKASTFDLGRYPRGSSKSVLFDRPGIVKVFCNIHANMSASIVVLDNPYFGTPGPDGTFRINGIPPGEYRVVAWHERAKPIGLQVRIETDETARLNFDIPLAHPDEAVTATGGEGRR